ncbi:unnamed protein product [Urochloa decumbens]|uniref:Uncharacterized protein n=2 Tax=Urochloa decumbens TaxID=240449 RepID=A0ABC9B152_9POAL
MESMNNLLRQLVSMNKSNNHDTATASGDYSHQRTWMKQLLELAFDSKNSVELYMQSRESHCCWLPWAMVARHRVVSRIRERDQRAPREHSSSLVRSVILDREFVDNSSVDQALLRLKVLRSFDGEGSGESSDDDGADESSDGEPQMDGSDMQQPTQSVVGDKQEQSDGGNNLQKQTQLDTGGKQQQSDSSQNLQNQTQLYVGDKQQQQPKLSDARDLEQQSDAGDKQLPSDYADKPPPQQHQPTQSDMEQQLDSDTGDKQPQSDGTDKLQQEQQSTPLDGTDKKEKRKKKNKKKIRVVTILVKDGMDEAAVGETVLKRFNRQRDENSNLKNIRRYKRRPVLHVYVRRPPVLPEIIVQIANQAKKQRRRYQYYHRGNSQDVSAAGDDEEYKDEKRAEDFMQKYYTSAQEYRQGFITKKKEYRQGHLLVLSGLSSPNILNDLKKFLGDLVESTKADNYLEFAIALCTNDSDAAKRCSYPATDNEPQINYSLLNIYSERAVALLPSSYKDDMSDGRSDDKSDDMSLIKVTVREIIDECNPDEVCMKMILHALYYNPDMTKKEMVRLKDSLVGTDHQEKEKRIITFCYQTLLDDYKNCLWYTAVFTRETNGRVRKASLLRRWIAQELIKEDKAKDCFDAMVEQKLINSQQVSGMGKVKSCAVHDLVHSLIIRESPTVEDLLLNNQLPIDNLDLIYSIRNGMKLHLAKSGITSCLNSMSTNSMLMLGVLDLEGCDDLNIKDLHTISKIRELKYLSLRNTNVGHLPKQIGQLKNLETLDIRGTTVLVFHTVLPKQKHLLAGRIIECQDNDIINSKESFSTVSMPRAVETMENLQILSCVKVTDGANELINVGHKLEHLKKLGVVLSGKKASLKDLFLQIEKLNHRLRSLSIRMEPPGNWDAADIILLKPPKLLESLHICNIRRGLPPRIKELHHLAKITLRETFLKQDDLCVLGMLPELRYLRLFYRSFGEGTITFGSSRRDLMFFMDFEDRAFKNLKNIAIKDDTITSVTLNILTELEKMTWSFSYMESLSGVQNLRSETHLVLDGGTYNQEERQKLERDALRNGINLKISPPQRGEESGVVSPAP